MNLSGVGRRYGLTGPWVLRDVDLDVPAGTLVRVEGANGSGKSTLLRLVAGIDAPSAGRITGRPPRTAYVPERFPAALPFTASAYLLHLGRVHGLGRREAAARAAAWLERFGAGAHARTPLAELSKGTGQKVAVAQALMADPDLLVLDEAWTGLDAAARAELDRAVGERVAAGGAVVFVDHDPRRLAGAADAVHAVSGGRVAPRATGPDSVLVGPDTFPTGPDSVLVGLTAPDAPDGLTGHTARSDTYGSGPSVRVTASGGRLPDGPLPGRPAREDGPGGSVTFTVPAAHSDALLRELLTSTPAWHIHRVDPATTTSRTP
ncbi:ATP-binding cassette domain-containing protein [Streptomyces lavendulocolor]|uniref:ATP-binding cassette domain-containing protein n=1 Tax=Streptomyces lavendulocolor TaxID=67316 RepID=A0ABV2W1D0_9ACTN